MKTLRILLEGGNVFKDAEGNPLTGRINQSDVPATVAWLEQLTGLDFTTDIDPDTKKPRRWLGSTGKAPTSGDLDLAVDLNDISKDQLAAKLTQWIVGHKLPPDEWIKKGGEVHLRTPIQGRPDLGYVQTDFMFFSNLDWGTFYYNQGAGSAYKGMNRAVLMSSLAKHYGLTLGSNGVFSRANKQLITMDPDEAARMILGPKATRANLSTVETIFAALAQDKDKEAKIKDFREYLNKEGLPQPDAVTEDADTYFLARLRDRIVNQGMQPLVERESANPYTIYEAAAVGVGGRAKGIEHLEDYVFREGTAGVNKALAIVAAFQQNSKTASVKWDGKPAVVFGRKPKTGEFVLTDDSGFGAVGYDGLFTSTRAIANNLSQRDANAAAKGNLANRVQTLLPTYQTVWPLLEAATPKNFRGYVKGDLMYWGKTDQPLPATEQEIVPGVVYQSAGLLVFRPNTVTYRIPVDSKLGQSILNSKVGVAVHTMYEDAGAEKQPLSGVKFNDVPGLFLILPIYAKPVETKNPYVAMIKKVLQAHGPAINVLFNPAELRAMKITDFAKLAVDYINRRVDPNDRAYTGDFSDLVPGFEAWLQSTQTAQKYSNIQQYLDSPTSNRSALQAAFVLFELLHDLKLDLLGKLDQQVPGNEGWVFATPAGYGKAVNRFDFSARNKARNNPQQG
jgi:hypothetical protein